MKREAKNNDDDQLAKKVQLGDQAAFGELYDRYSRPIYQYAFARLGNREEAEDVLQETFIRAMKSLPKFSFRSSFKTWLYHLAFAAVMDAWRRHYKKGTLPLLEFCAGKDPEEVISEQAWDQELDQQEMRINELLNNLPEKYRQVLNLRFVKSLSTREIAVELEITENNVKIRQFRALRQLREYLVNKNDEKN